MTLHRRSFLQLLSTAAAAYGFLPGIWAQGSPEEQDLFARLRYEGGDWFTDTSVGDGGGDSSDLNFLARLKETTTIRPAVVETVLAADDARISDFPFLYATGHREIHFTDSEIRSLSKILRSGSLLFAEDCGGGTFRTGFIREMMAVLPGEPLVEIPMSHEIFEKPFKIDRILGGDKLVRPYIEGVEIDGRLAVVYTDNDLGCAWEGHRCAGGEEQRRHAFELGINIICYALTG